MVSNLTTPVQPPGSSAYAKTPLESRLQVSSRGQPAAREKLERITTETDNFIRKIERQKRRLSDLDSKIATLKREVELKRKDMSKARQAQIAQRRGHISPNGESCTSKRGSVIVGIGHIVEGDELEARCKGWKKYYKGVVDHVNADGSLAVAFDDGDHVDHVQQHDVRPVGGKVGMGSTRSTCSQAAWDVKLDVARVQLNDVLGQNRDVRLRINELRREQNRGLEQHRKMKEQYRTLTEHIAELREGIALAREGAEEASALRLEVINHKIAEVETLKKQYYDHGVLLEAGSEGYQEQIKIREEQAEQEVQKKDAAKRTLDLLKTTGGVGSIFGGRKGSALGGLTGKEVLAGSLSIEEEAQLKSKIQRGHWMLAKGRLQVKNLENRVQNYEEGFNLIKTRTGIDDIQEMVAKFCAREEENFGLFNYVNELSGQIEAIEQSIESEQMELDKFRGKDDDEATGQSILKSLEDKLVQTDTHAESARKRIETNQRLLEGLKAAIASTFHRIGCKSALVETLLRSEKDRKRRNEKNRKRKERAARQQRVRNILTKRISKASAAVVSRGSDLEAAGQEESKADAATNENLKPDDCVVRESAGSDEATVDNGGGTDIVVDGEKSLSPKIENNSNSINAVEGTISVSDKSGVDENDLISGGQISGAVQNNADSVEPSRSTSMSAHSKKPSGAVRTPSAVVSELEEEGADDYDDFDDDDSTAGDDLEITESNMIQYLGVVEQRVTELLLAYASQLSRRGEEVTFLSQEIRRGVNDSPVHHSPKNVPHLPNVNKNDEWLSDDDEEEMLRPMRYEELMERISSSLAVDRQQQSLAVGSDAHAGGGDPGDNAGVV